MFEKDTSLQYEQFKPFIDNIDTSARFIGSGIESRVYKLELGIGTYAVKMAQKNAQNWRGRIMDRGLMTKNKIESGLRGVGINGIEQFVTGSIEDYAAIYRYVDGVKLDGVIDSYVKYITEEQKERFNQCVVEATEAGLSFDVANPSGANAFYSPDNGFTLIDYSLAYSPLTYEQNWSSALRSLGPVALQAFAPRYY